MPRRFAGQALLPWVLTLVGFTAIVAQVVLTRELVVVFHGNEMALGLILASWLLWTAVGSGLLGRLVAAARSPGPIVAALQTTMALVLPFAILTVRAAGRAYGVTTGEILGPGPMLLTSNLALSLVCLVSGALFAASSRLYAAVRGWGTAAATSTVYLLETLGSALGGLVAGILLIRYLHSIEIALILSLLNLISALALTVTHPSRRLAGIAFLIVVYAVVILPFGGRAIESASLRYMWKGFDLLDSQNSIYGNLVVLSTGETRSVYENGVMMVTVPDVPSAEEAVHFALLQHPSPEKLLLVGGGIGGALAEALKHPTIQRAAYVELDPTVISIGRLYFSESWLPVEKDPRVVTYKTDGRLFLSRTRERFDVIIINLPDPKTAQLNRFYTREFFERASRRLAPGGLLSIRATGAENYISAELGQFLRCINKTLREVFDNVVVIPGSTIHFFAADEGGSLTADPAVLAQRLEERILNTVYIRPYYFRFRMSPDRMSDLQERIEPASGTPVNSDLDPVAYYFSVILWSTRFHDTFRGAIQAPGKIGFTTVVIALWLATLLYVTLSVWKVRGRRRLRVGAGGCVAAMGLTMMGIEVMLLLAFQSLYGYVYYHLAMLIAAFMVGMMFGSALSLRRYVRGGEGWPTRREAASVLKLQTLAVVVPPALFVLIAWLSGVSNTAGVFLASNVLFPLLALLSGMLGGYQFPVASRVYFGVSGNTVAGSGPGAVYAIDLAGACIGAAVIGAYLIPVFGFFKTTLIMAVVNVGPALVLASSLPVARAAADPS